MPKSIPIILLFYLTATAGAAVTHRRILHQPFFPQDSSPPSQPPTPPVPKYPFSTVPVNTPFFPNYPSPPPPLPAESTASFPANISSISVPHPTNSKSPGSKLIIAAVAAVIAAVIVVSLAVFLHFRRKSNRSSSSQSKTQRSEDNNCSISTTTTATATTVSLRHIPTLQRPSQTSSEFLYLGTLVNSHGAVPPYIGNVDRKTDSPELRPLPPLNTARKIAKNADVASSKDDEDEEFYSPKGSLHGRDSSIGTIGSASRRDFPAVEVENLEGFVSNSSSIYSSSDSGSLSLSPENSLTPRNSIPKSPDLIEIQTFNRTTIMAPTKKSESPSPPSSSSRFSRSEESSPRISNDSDQDLGSESSKLHSPPLMPTLESDESSIKSGSDVIIRKLHSPPLVPHPPGSESSTKVDSDVITQTLHSPPLVPPPELESSTNIGSDVTIRKLHSPPLAPPPPPPPPPPLPSKVFESPRTPTPPGKKPVFEPPSLVNPLRPMVLESPTLISPMELPSNDLETVKKIESLNKEKVIEYTNEAFEPSEDTTITPKPKLKPLHWDKVRASSDREMVWDQLKSSSFKLDEEMIETLFVVNNPKPSPKEATRWQVLPPTGQENGNWVLDPKKSQNIAILLRALNVTVEEVCEGLSEGNSDILGTDLLESLLKMAPTKEEERKLKEHKDDSPIKLGAPEKFLKAVLDIPHAFKRVDAMLYISNFESEVEYLKKSFETLEAACEELRTNRMFLKLLEAVLKTGNRMNVGTNRGDAHAFKLDTLLKLVDIKGADGKTTLLHFVVQEMIRSEGSRLSSSTNDDTKCRKIGLKVVSSLSSDLSNVKKAASMDSEVLSSDVFKLSKGIVNITDVVRLNEANPFEESVGKFSESMNRFMKNAEEEIIRVQAQESVALSLVKEITEYFHGNSAREEAHPFRIFLVVRDFLTSLDRVCKEVGAMKEQILVSSAHKFPVPVNPMLQPVSGFSMVNNGEGLSP